MGIAYLRRIRKAPGNVASTVYMQVYIYICCVAGGLCFQIVALHPVERCVQPYTVTSRKRRIRAYITHTDMFKLHFISDSVPDVYNYIYWKGVLLRSGDTLPCQKCQYTTQVYVDLPSNDTYIFLWWVTFMAIRGYTYYTGHDHKTMLVSVL